MSPRRRTLFRTFGEPAGFPGRRPGQFEAFRAALEADDAARIEELRQGKVLGDALPPLSVRG
jgi:hypothetical protein